MFKQPTPSPADEVLVCPVCNAITLHHVPGERCWYDKPDWAGADLTTAGAGALAGVYLAEAQVRFLRHELRREKDAHHLAKVTFDAFSKVQRKTIEDLQRRLENLQAHPDPRRTTCPMDPVAEHRQRLEILHLELSIELLQRQLAAANVQPPPLDPNDPPIPPYVKYR